MDVRCDADFSDVDQFLKDGEWEVEKKMIDVGDEVVKYERKWQLSGPHVHFENIQ